MLLHLILMFLSGTRMVMQHWDFTGSTVITENHIRLTPDLQSKKGALWNTVVSTTCLLVPMSKITSYQYYNDMCKGYSVLPVLYLCARSVSEDLLQ